MKRGIFGREFKIGTVKLIRERGVAVAGAARDLDVHENVLRKWGKDLAGILAIASSDKQKPGVLSDAGLCLLSQESLVAGTGIGRDRHPLVVEI